MNPEVSQRSLVIMRERTDYAYPLDMRAILVHYPRGLPHGRGYKHLMCREYGCSFHAEVLRRD